MFDQSHRANFRAAVLAALGIAIEEDEARARVLIRLPSYVPREMLDALTRALVATSPTWLRVEVKIGDLEILDAREVVDVEARPIDERLLLLVGPMGGESDAK